MTISTKRPKAAQSRAVSGLHCKTWTTNKLGSSRSCAEKASSTPIPRPGWIGKTSGQRRHSCRGIAVITTTRSEELSSSGVQRRLTQDEEQLAFSPPELSLVIARSSRTPEDHGCWCGGPQESRALSRTGLGAL
ncbi:hypothetical protein GWK47_005050 [Chionoecetes opilio]|uniref:Uncharacterized protein n=1 Tax=Chionoecetes opilio TaxID=41210 RepID=A0A8J5CZW5_CHIOP|nr:hypothetical protein GWK47_005050 [Chionoecetes opilio]